jgi:hypothetical protein
LWGCVGLWYSLPFLRLVVTVTYCHLVTHVHVDTSSLYEYYILRVSSRTPADRLWAPPSLHRRFFTTFQPLTLQSFYCTSVVALFPSFFSALFRPCSPPCCTSVVADSRLSLASLYNALFVALRHCCRISVTTYEARFPFRTSLRLSSIQISTLRHCCCISVIRFPYHSPLLKFCSSQLPFSFRLCRFRLVAPVSRSHQPHSVTTSFLTFFSSIARLLCLPKILETPRNLCLSLHT